MHIYPNNKHFNQSPHYLPSLFVTSSSLNLWHSSQFDLFKHKLPTSSSLSAAVVRAKTPPACPPYLPPSSLLFSHVRLSQFCHSCHHSTIVSTAWLCTLCQWCWHPHAFICGSQGSLYALFHDALVHRMSCLPQLNWRHQTLLHQP